MYEELFYKRLVELRLNKGVSAHLKIKKACPA